MESLHAAIVRNTFSKESVHRRLALLQRVLETVVYTKSDSNALVGDRFLAALEGEAAPEDYIAVKAWGSDWLATINEQTLHASLDMLKKTLASEPTLTVYVPVALDAAGEAIIGAFCRAELTGITLLDFEIDQAVLGGCAFVQNGHYHDYSFSGRFAKLPHVVTEVLNSYVS